MVGIDDERLSKLVIRPNDTIREAMTCIEQGHLAIALVVDDSNRLIGTISDGDVRRALLSGTGLDQEIAEHVNGSPAVVSEGADRAWVLDLMQARRLTQIPEVDREGRLVGLHSVHEVLRPATLPNRALVLAGGKGTRLGPLTQQSPKPMLEVAGRPILERIVLHLVSSGIRHLTLSVSYLAEKVETHFGDGAQFGCEIDYIREDTATPLGTGGPLRLLLDKHGEPDHPILVMNGDLVASFSVGSMLEEHAGTGASMTVGLAAYSHDVPYGVVSWQGEASPFISGIQEKPRWSGYVNAGIYVLSPELLHRVPSRYYAMTELVEECLREGLPVAGSPLSGAWQDIGLPGELERARGNESAHDAGLR